MNGLLRVAYREIEDHRKLVPAAMLVGFAPFTIVLALGMDRSRTPLVASAVVSLLALLVALILGFTTISGEMVASRHGFFFARPLAWWQIWGGKVLSGVLLALGCGILAAIPATVASLGGKSSATVLACLVAVAVSAPYAADLVSNRSGFLLSGPLARWQTWWGDMLAIVLLTLGAIVLAAIPLILVYWTPESLTLVGDFPSDASLLGCLVVVAFAAGHAAGVVWRSRDGAWIGLDLGLVVAAALGARQVFAELARNWAPTTVAAWLAAILLIAGASQVAVGRTDLRRGHRVLSLVFWSLLWTALLAVALFAWLASGS